MSRIVIVGAGIAGLSTAQNLRGLGYDGEIVLADTADELPYQRPPLSKSVLLGGDPAVATVITEDELSALDIDFRPGTTATHLDVARRQVTLGHTPVDADHIVIATGAVAAAPPQLAHLHHRGALMLRTTADALALHHALSRSEPSIAIIGAGVLGSEIAAAARARGARTVLLAREQQRFGPLPWHLAPQLLDLHRSHGVEVHTSPAHIDGVPGDWTIAVDGDTTSVHTLVLACGITKATSWLTGTTAVGDSITCGANGAVSPGVWAVGDVARWAGRDDVSSDTQAGALAQARSVASAIVGVPHRSALPFFWSDVHGVRIQAAGRIGPDHEHRRHPTDGGYTITCLAGGTAAGVVGWNSPREFRDAVRELTGSMTGAKAP